MKNLRPTARPLGFCLTALVLSACGDSGNTPTTSGDSESASSDNSGTDPTNTTPPTTQTTPGETTEEEPTGGSMSATGTDTGNEDTGVTDSASDTTDAATMAINPVCGDGVVEGTEQCDDGNDEPGDGCEPGCVNSAVCGNGMVEVGEICDDNNTEDGDDCSADCSAVTSPVVCGDAKQEGDEQCDDGNPDAGDGCEPDCTITPPECGNGKVERGEACDDGNAVNGGLDDFCKNDCSVFIPPSCQAPPEYAVCDTNINLADKADKTTAHKAMGICNDTPNNSVVISDYTFTSSSPTAWQVAKGYGTFKTDTDMDPATPDELYYSPREGDAFLIVSSGNISAPNAQGIVTEGPNSQGGSGENGNPDDDALPPPFKSQVGSNNGAGGTPFQDCQGAPNFQDCSDTLQAQWIKGSSNPNDKIWFTFKSKVPAGTFGYTFDFVFCSSEWPSWVNTQYNDLLITYQVDPGEDDPAADPPIDPYSGNITFIPDPNDPAKGLPLTITALDPYFKGPGFTNNEAPLAGTGFESNACTEWFTAKGGVQPGSDVTIGFFLADMGDTALATVAILDNFRWDCEGCIPSEVDDCGVMEPQ